MQHLTKITAVAAMALALASASGSAFAATHDSSTAVKSENVSAAPAIWIPAAAPAIWIPAAANA